MSLPKRSLWIPTDPTMLKKNEQQYEKYRKEVKKNSILHLTDIPRKIINWDEEIPKE